jgi:hypothetical protein
MTGMFRWLLNNEPVWLASAVMAVAGFIVFVWTKYGLDSEIGTAFMALLPVLLAPLTRRATSSRATVEKVAAQAADTGNAALAVEAHK